MPSKRLCYRMIALAEILLSEGNVDEAYRVAKVALRGFVTFAERGHYYLDGLHMFLGAIELFTSQSCTEQPEVCHGLIRLYSRLLIMKHPEFHDWDYIEHAVLRSCVMHGVSGGPAAAAADLTRKVNSWKINPDNTYTGLKREDNPESLTDTEDEGLVQPMRTIPVRRPRPRVTDKLIKQRQSPTIAQWQAALNSNR
jgi:hypothetical protein